MVTEEVPESGRGTRTIRPYLRALGAWDSVLFAAICVLDMCTTIYWVEHGVATEANPLLQFWLQKSVFLFGVAKVASFLPLLMIAAYYRLSKPTFIAYALRTAIVAYVAIYLIAVLKQFV